MALHSNSDINSGLSVTKLIVGMSSNPNMQYTIY
jgi:hypothetical protein